MVRAVLGDSGCSPPVYVAGGQLKLAPHVLRSSASFRGGSVVYVGQDKARTVLRHGGGWWRTSLTWRSTRSWT
jgi:hypothetical protein